MERRRERGGFVALRIGMDINMERHPVGAGRDGVHAGDLLECSLMAVHHGLNL